jgi:cell wall-associated NlpC family hydrolase
MTADDIIAAARETLGTPYRHQGRINGVALDCIGVAIYVAQKLGFDYLDLPAYNRIPHHGLLETMVEKQPCLVRVFDRQPGDLFLMRFTDDPQHVAIFTGETIIHSSSQTERVVENRLSDELEKQVVAVYRFIGV